MPNKSKSKTRAVFKNERQMRQHHLERQQRSFELLSQISGPCAMIRQPWPNLRSLNRRYCSCSDAGTFPSNKFVEPESRALIHFRCKPEDGLDVAPFVGEQTSSSSHPDICHDWESSLISKMSFLPSLMMERNNNAAGELPNQRRSGWDVDDFEAGADKFPKCAAVRCRTDSTESGSTQSCQNSNYVTDGRILAPPPR